MTTSVRRPLLEDLKDWSALLVGAVALLYMFGFTVHWAYFRLLGIDISGQAFDYLRFAADYVTSIVSSVPQLLIAFVFYSPKLVQSPLLEITVPSIVIVVLSVALYVRPLKLNKLRKGRVALVLWWTLTVVIVWSFWHLFRTEYDIAKVRDILQPVDAAEIQQMQNQLSDSRNVDQATLLEIRSSNVVRIYNKYTEKQTDAPGFQYFNKWFNPLISPHGNTERRPVYLALLLLNLILLMASILQLMSLRGTDAEQERIDVRQQIGSSWLRALIVVLTIGLLIQIFLFPFVYAAVGRNLTYPLVTLKLTPSSDSSTPESKNEEPAKPETNATSQKTNSGVTEENWTHCVYLIAHLDNEVIVFDRLNFFQLKRIPRSRILTISQVFAASPFESCSKDQSTFTPCETLWMSEQTPVLDF